MLGSPRRSTKYLAIPEVDSLDPGPIVDTGDAIVIASHACRNIARVPKDSSAPQRWPVSTHQATGGTTGLEIDGPRFYCASGNYVHLLDSSTGEVKELVAYGRKAGAVRKIGEDLYWTDSYNLELNGAALVMLANGAPAPVAVGTGIRRHRSHFVRCA